MKVILTLMVSLMAFPPASGQQKDVKIYGTYEDHTELNHRLMLHCNNTAQAWLWRDKNEPISGKFTVRHDTLILQVNLSEFDTLYSTKWNGVVKFLVRRNRLIRVIQVNDKRLENAVNTNNTKHPYLKVASERCD